MDFWFFGAGIRAQNAPGIRRRGAVFFEFLGSAFGGEIYEAAAVWQWWNFLLAQVPGGKAALRINMDETSICLYQGASKGTIIARKRKATDEAVDDEALGRENLVPTANLQT